MQPDNGLTAQAEAIESLRQKIAYWIKEHSAHGGHFDTSLMIPLANFVGDACATEVTTCALPFSSWDAYDSQPYALVFQGSGQTLLPDVYVMGWRECDARECGPEGLPEGTVVHDHGISEAAIRVVRGSIREATYNTTSPHSGTGMVYVTERVLREGECALLRAPVVHDVHDFKDGRMSLSVHVYFPRLTDQRIFEVRGGRLIETGTWSEGAP